MQQIQAQTTSSVYTDACTIEDVWKSPGGFYVVQAGDAFMQLQYVQPGDGLGQAQWTPDVLVPVANGILAAGTVGVRFRDGGSATGPAVVTAALSNEAEPAIQIGAPGAITATVAVTQVTGIIPATGTTPTAGSGFTYTHTNGTGVYVFTFTTPFANAPDVQATTASPRATNAICSVTAVTANGFTVNTWVASTVAATDIGFSFLAVTTV